jgi:deoxyribodipyrimidine photo-lyase
MKSKRTLVWLENTLRVHDNEMLVKASQQGLVFPVFIFDPRWFQRQSLGFPKTGSFRAQFLIESVSVLKQSLRQLGTDLIISEGLPEEIIPQLVQQLCADQVFVTEEVTSEEMQVRTAIEKKLIASGVLYKSYWVHTLYHYEDIPWPIKRLPDIFTSFRKEVEAESRVRDVFPKLEKIHFAQEVDSGQIPSLDSFQLTKGARDLRTAFVFDGGELAALERVDDYIWQKRGITTYKETRNQLLGADYSSKFSAWLANGSLSPRYVYWQIKKFEEENGSNASTYWLFFELLWRDYFRFVARKFGNRIFQPNGLCTRNITWNHDREVFEKWRLGETGVPFVDANMKELLLTGFMSNRGRQNVASYLTKDLKIDWRWGAAWFESQLIDYDVSSNWLNWAYVAGVGNDPREDRYFNIESQVKKYDPQHRYISHWLQAAGKPS